MGFSNRGEGQVSLTGFGTTYTQDFNTLGNSGESNVLPVGWALVETGTNANGNYNAGTGSDNIGDTYSFGLASTTERGFGEQQSISLLPTIGASFTNNTGSLIGSLIISYKGEQWRVGAVDRIDRLDFQYSTTATGLTTGTYTDFNALDFTSPVQSVVGALNGNDLPNFTVLSSSIPGLSIGAGNTFWIRWNDFNATGDDDGQAVDSFSITPCPVVSCPANITICLNAAILNLTGGAPGGGTYSGTGVTANQFDPAIAGVGVHIITYTYTTGICTGACTFNITVNALPVVTPGSYGPACTNDPNIILAGLPVGGVWTGIGVVNTNQFDPNAGTQTIHYTYTNANGCTVTANTTITVNACLMAPEIRWVLLQAGQITDPPPMGGPICTSTSNCPTSICFGMQYTPSITGTMTSYTTGYLFDCYNNGNDPVLSNTTCTLTNNSFKQDECANFDLVQWNFLGASTSAPVTANVPVIVHQVCFAVPTGAPVNIDQFTPFSVSIDLPGGGATTDGPVYVPLAIDGGLYCTLLPVRYLEFNAVKFAELTSSLDWVTAEEINNDYFEVQRSNDITGSFTTIGKVDAVEHPKSVNPYQFYDYAARPGVNYYRLKQFDRDGQFAYSPIRTVLFSTTSFSVKAWPNPVNDLLNVFISGAGEAGRLELIDVAGRHVVSQEFTDGDSSHEIAVDRVAPGVYTLVVLTGAERHVEKIIIME
jgi:hypothetical protein